TRGRFAEADAGYARALAAGPNAPATLRARALWGRASLATHAGAYEAAADHAAAALALAEAEDEAGTVARALIALGSLELFADPPRARSHLQRAAALADAAGDTW